MKRAIIIACVVLAAVFFFFKFKGPSFQEILEDAKNVSSYKLVGDMELLENDELKSYEVSVSYLNNKKHKYYQVDLYDKNLNQSQIIVRNEEGVFVMTPTLNQMFKFQSHWPENGPKPYIYASMLELFEKNKAEKLKKGYMVEGAIEYPYDSRIKKEEVIFDKSLKPLQVTCYDEDEREIVVLKIKKFNLHPKLKVSDFKQDTILQEAKEAMNVSMQDDVLYPLSMMGATLESESVAHIDGLAHHILRFTGDKNYTVIETQEPSDNTKVATIHDEVIDLIDGFAYYTKDKLTMIQSGIVCHIYSHDLSKEEMLSILTSMQSLATK